MSILEKAQDLATAIAESPELRHVKETEIRIMIDMEAREIIEAYQNLQMEAMNAGVMYEDLPEDKKQEIEALEKKMNDHPVINDYLSASQELNQILESVNMVIQGALTGESGSSCSSCSTSDCGSCGGSCGH